MRQNQFVNTVQEEGIHLGVTVHEHFSKQIQNRLLIGINCQEAVLQREFNVQTTNL